MLESRKRWNYGTRGRATKKLSRWKGIERDVDSEREGWREKAGDRYTTKTKERTAMKTATRRGIRSAVRNDG